MKDSPHSHIFGAAASLAFFIVNLFAVYMLLRGHNLPGGGFIAGLITAISLLMLNLSKGVEETKKILRVGPVRLAAIGVGVALLSGCWGLLNGRPFLDQSNWHLHGVPLLGELHLGTPLLFDVGVYLLVVGSISKIIFVFAQSSSGQRALVDSEIRRYASPLEEPIEGSGAPGEDAP